VRLWLLSCDHSSATCVATLKGHSGRVLAVAFHTTAPLLATGSNDETVMLWLLSCDHLSATCVATLKGHFGRVLAVAFHPTAPLLATGSRDETVMLWLLSCDHSSATCVATLGGAVKGQEDSNIVLAVAFHPTAPLLATCGFDKILSLWR
jgi:WD40 repeat protein